MWVFGLGTYNNSTAKDLLVWHYYLKQGSRERNHGNEAFHKLFSLCTMVHVLYERSLNQNPTIYSAVDSVAKKSKGWQLVLGGSKIFSVNSTWNKGVIPLVKNFSFTKSVIAIGC